MVKILHKVFSTFVKEISQELTPLGEYGSEVSHFIPKPRNFADVNVFREHKATLAKGNSQRDKESNKQSDFPN